MSIKPDEVDLLKHIKRTLDAFKYSASTGRIIEAPPERYVVAASVFAELILENKSLVSKEQLASLGVDIDAIHKENSGVDPDIKG